ncbi:MAG TPA: ATP cone domain-containing protein [Candidatus Paceibacterota bacterium]
MRNFRKRDGTVVPFDHSRIAYAIERAMIAENDGDSAIANEIALAISERIVKTDGVDYIVPLERIQDAVEHELIARGFARAAAHYIRYRDEHRRIRPKRKYISPEIAEAYELSAEIFGDNYLARLMEKKYARWIDDKSRFETFPETVTRYVDYMRKRAPILTESEISDIDSSIREMHVMPSMRLLQFSGPVIDVDDIAAYNCAYIAPTCIADIADIAYILMRGVGLCFSIERNIHEFPIVKTAKAATNASIFKIADSREGWCDAIKIGLNAWFDGDDVVFDYSAIRPFGARLKTTGGTASGPEPLREFLDYARAKIRAKVRERLGTIDWYDIICKIIAFVQVGNIRRAAGACLFEPEDDALRTCKSGRFYEKNAHRAVTNISAIYDAKPSAIEMMRIFSELAANGTGEPGIFNRSNPQKQLPERRYELFRKNGLIGENGAYTYAEYIGSNPCFEIILPSHGFCNLTEVVCRENDTPESLREKVRIATIIGTYQATLTRFSYIAKKWRTNCERERLLGVSLTGVWDCPILNANLLRELRDYARVINAQYAERFGITPATAITCVKPSGSVSKLVGSSSGMSPRFARFYVQRITLSRTSPMFKLLRDSGVPYRTKSPQIAESDAIDFLVDVPIESPASAVFQTDIDAKRQLEMWLMLKENWCEHNPSTTIYVRDTEWLEVANWVYTHFDSVGSLAFFPRDEHVYPVMMMEKITEDEYRRLLGIYRKINFSKIVAYETEADAEATRELACAGGACEL